MPYQDFTLATVRKQFGLTLESDRDLFPNPPDQVPLVEAFTAYLNYTVPLALAINTEKARSEMIIAPMLVELKRLLKDQVSLFSGIEFNVDPDQNLSGFCDFIVSLSRQQLYLSQIMGILVGMVQPALPMEMASTVE
ncbi:MAG: hypothetical protein O3A14_10685 [Cyanobacteria bacterium]|nr:hypothetical protein [Cyanobacteriota bacterium]